MVRETFFALEFTRGCPSIHKHEVKRRKRIIDPTRGVHPVFLDDPEHFAIVLRWFGPVKPVKISLQDWSVSDFLFGQPLRIERDALHSSYCWNIRRVDINLCARL